VILPIGCNGDFELVIDCSTPLGATVAPKVFPMALKSLLRHKPDRGSVKAVQQSALRIGCGAIALPA
jgi:hypothetical protein